MTTPAWKKRFAARKRIERSPEIAADEEGQQAAAGRVTISSGTRRGMRSETAPSQGPTPSMSTMVTVLTSEM